MNFKELSNIELSKLTPDELRNYMNEYNQQICNKNIITWNKINWDEKTKLIYSGYHFFINRRGIESINLEEEIDFALKNLNTEKTKVTTLLAVHYNTILKNEKYTFFNDISSPFSQWYKSSFECTAFLIEGIGQGMEYEIKRKDILKEFNYNNHKIFTSVEQFVMYHKAMIFLDRDSGKKILNTNDVFKINELGMQVKNYDESVWKYFRSKVVYEGNKAKFTQNENLKKFLLATKGTTLVEAAPNDSIWGIGLSENDSRALRRETWLGKNLLGEILTYLRTEISGNY
jgi:ribA/ribD-fused uncharacterized protein